MSFPCLFCGAAGERGRYRTPCLLCSVSPKQEWTCSPSPSPLQHISSHPLVAAAKLVCPSSLSISLFLGLDSTFNTASKQQKPTFYHIAWIRAPLSSIVHIRHSKLPLIHSRVVSVKKNKHSFLQYKRRDD